MFDVGADVQYEIYNKARVYLLDNPDILVNLEEYLAYKLQETISNNITEIKEDYDEASLLYPFWKNYPPDDRGRQPKGDQYPWIEVGEHAVGAKLPRLLAKDFDIRDTGLPTGADQRFVLRNDKIKELTNGLTDALWLFIDIKSVGPRDDAHHAVMSHNQVSGDGIWENLNEGIKNTILTAQGKRTSHSFHCSLPPIFVLSDGTILPAILMAVKPVYKMLSLEASGKLRGQPLLRICLATIPNGLLLTKNPGYLNKYPGLLFPGKDDKTKNPLKVRARVDFGILEKIATWRYQEIFA